MNLLILLLKSN